ncbi:hypothetical protein [Flavobacterium palustre]|uniref:hypothetical protein n=1 Tax=Flavobacterium palustre TaxID=1476463 RepID=UPI00360FD15B
MPIRVALDNLEEERASRLGRSELTELWRQSGGEADILDRTITRWRSQAGKRLSRRDDPSGGLALRIDAFAALLLVHGDEQLRLAPAACR